MMDFTMAVRSSPHNISIVYVAPVTVYQIMIYDYDTYCYPAVMLVILCHNHRIAGWDAHRSMQHTLLLRMTQIVPTLNWWHQSSTFEEGKSV